MIYGRHVKGWMFMYRLESRRRERQVRQRHRPWRGLGEVCSCGRAEVLRVRGRPFSIIQKHPGWATRQICQHARVCRSASFWSLGACDSSMESPKHSADEKRSHVRRKISLGGFTVQQRILPGWATQEKPVAET